MEGKKASWGGELFDKGFDGKEFFGMKLKRKKSEERLVCRGGKIELEIYFSRPPPFFFFLSFFLKKTRKQIAGPFISLAAPALLSLKRTIALYAMLPSRSPSVDS